MMVGRYCVVLDSGKYYNTLTHQTIQEEDLKPQHMLAGQERQAIDSVLLTPLIEQVQIMPSMECNLRCPHCYVAHLLEKPSGNPKGSSDPERVVEFLARLQEYQSNPHRGCYFVGGEPFLHPEFLRTVVQTPGHKFGITTNGVFDFPEMQDILARFGNIAFSVDGLPEDHNRTRRSLTKIDDVFAVTYRNIRLTCSSFPDKEVVVQGSTVRKEYSEEEKSKFYVLMRLAGVKTNRIYLSVEMPNAYQGPSEAIQKVIPKVIRTSPCCDYSSRILFIYRNQVYDTYHCLAERTPLGSLEDGLEVLMERRQQRILGTMPMLFDKVCMEECRAVGICWGYCSNSRYCFSNNQPSSICDRAWKEQEIVHFAQGSSEVKQHLLDKYRIVAH